MGAIANDFQWNLGGDRKISVNFVSLCIIAVFTLTIQSQKPPATYLEYLKYLANIEPLKLHYLCSAMVDDSVSSASTVDSDNLPREVRVAQLRNTVDTLHMADEVATRGYLITSSELADLMDVNASAVTSRGDNWVWRNWVVSRVRREGNQILWQLERID